MYEGEPSPAPPAAAHLLGSMSIHRRYLAAAVALPPIILVTLRNLLPHQAFS